MEIEGRFTGLIADPAAESRMRLKQATSAVALFSGMQLCSSLREALGHLSSAEKAWDVIFIAEKFPGKDIASFIIEAKQSIGGETAAYVLVLDASHQDCPTVATNVMRGIDSFLFAPYSVNYLVEITGLAARVKNERRVARERLAVKLLIKDIIERLDMVAFLKSLDCAPGQSIRELKRLCECVRQFSPETEEIYFETILTMFEDKPLPERLRRLNQYKGASQRVKRRLEEKMEKDLAEQDGGAHTAKVQRAMKVLKKGF